jgi:hypothetical protein
MANVLLIFVIKKLCNSGMIIHVQQLVNENASFVLE